MGMDLLEAYMMIGDETGISDDRMMETSDLGLDASIGDVADAFANVYIRNNNIHNYHSRKAVKQRVLKSVVKSFAYVSGVPENEITQETILSSLPLD